MKADGSKLVLLIALVLPACVLEAIDEGDLEGEDIGETESEVLSSNGMSLNGMSLNGMSLNGMSLNGMSLNGMSLNGMSLNGSQLTGFKSGGQQVSGTALVGTTMVGQLASGGTLSLRIDSAAALPAPNTDVWAYGVSYLSGSTWTPLCGVSGGQPVRAIPLTGTWNNGSGVTGGGSWTPTSTTSFTLGCRGAALAKCVELGYKPWKTVSGTLLRNHHQACTRMLRGDYCGNGKAWTTNGTPINVFDNLNIQTDTYSWATDAGWKSTGATCADAIREFQPGAPSCQAALENVHTCGGFTDGALIVSEYDE
jgi:hypothetical protein